MDSFNLLVRLRMGNRNVPSVQNIALRTVIFPERHGSQFGMGIPNEIQAICSGDVFLNSVAYYFLFHMSVHRLHSNLPLLIHRGPCHPLYTSRRLL